MEFLLFSRLINLYYPFYWIVSRILLMTQINLFVWLRTSNVDLDIILTIPLKPPLGV